MSDEQMATIANTLTQIQIEVAAHRSTTDEVLKGQKETMIQHGNTLYGSDGNTGLRVDVALLKDTDQRRTWLLRGIISAIVTAIVGGAATLFNISSNRP